jgi:ATP-dependent exoDNAse (exonuclease V) beta subunit
MGQGSWKQPPQSPLTKGELKGVVPLTKGDSRGLSHCPLPLSFRDFAILVRSNNDADPFLRALGVKGIPHRFSGNRGLYKRDEIRFLISFLRVITDFNDSANLYNLSSSIIYQMNPVDLTLCLNIAHRRNRSLYEVFSNIITQEGGSKGQGSRKPCPLPLAIKPLSD